jgi:multidrug efflux system membrane fusion protein
MKKSNQFKICGVVVAGIIIIALLTYWRIKSSYPRKIAAQMPLVQTEKVQTGVDDQSYSYSGEVRGRYESKLAFQVGGKIIRRNVDLGSAVGSDSVLMQIDPVDVRQGVDARKAQVNAAESQYRLARDNYYRFKEVYDNNHMSQAEFQNYQNAYAAAGSLLRQAQAQYQEGMNQLRYCNLYAGSAGVVSAVNAEVGQVVAPGQPVLTLVRGHEFEIQMSLPENRMKEIKLRDQAEVTFWALPDVIIMGRVREIAPMADPLTRTFQVRIALLNPPRAIKLGMTATVTMKAPESSAICIPLAAIYQTADTAEVWTVTNQMVHLRKIKVGEFSGSQIKVLEGLRPGEVIVTAGVHKLQEGVKVRTVAKGDEVE